MTIGDIEKYQQHRANRGPGAQSTVVELWLPVLLFGSVGAMTWAIRGSDGWDGIDGSMVPGLAWALLWYYLCHRKGIDARGMVLWLGMGIALGGELGYGQYVSWIRGTFNFGDEVIHIAPWVGYAWFAICGFAKGVTGGVFLGWTLHGKASSGIWLIRVFLVFLLLVILLNLGAPLLGVGAVDWLGERVVQHCPWMIFPHADLGIYAGEMDGHQERTVWTNTQNFAVMIWGLVAMLVAALHRDRATLISGAILGGGFAIGYPLSAAWCLGYIYAPGYVDWWKIWELQAGFNLGFLCVLAMLWAIRQVDKAHAPNGTPLKISGESQQRLTITQEWRKTAFTAFCGFVLVYVMGREYFFWTGLCLALFYVAVMVLSMRTATSNDPPHRIDNRRLDVLLAFSVFFLIFRLLQGVTSHGGIVLELYEPEAVDNYAWPAARVVLFAPLAVILIIATLVAMRRILKAEGASQEEFTHLPERMVDLLTFIGLVGAISIWPTKIGLLYALCVCFAVFALTRLNRRFDDINNIERNYR